MSIPGGWKKVKFGDVVNKVNDKVPNRDEWTFERYIGGEHFDEGEIRITRSAPIEGNEEVIGSAFHMRFKPGQVLYVTRNPRLRKGGMVDFEGVCSNVSFVMEADETQLLQSLLPFIIQTEDFVRHTCNNAHGSTNPFLNWKDIAKYEFLLPPIEEQKKISEVLWSIEESLKKFEFALNLYKKRISQVINGLIYSSSKRYKIVTIGEVSKTFAGGTPSRKNNDYYGGNILWIKSGEVNSGEIIETEERITEEGYKNSSAKIIPKNSVVLAMYGATAGKVAILRKEATANQAVLAILPKDNSFDYRYIYYVLLSKYKEMVTMVQGAAQPNLSKTLIDKINIPLPTLEEQHKIIQVIESVDINTKRIRSHLNLLKNLRNKLSNELLKGSVRLK